MAEETHDHIAEASDAAVAPAQKKIRQKRKPRTAAEATAIDTANLPESNKKTRAKRGSKTTSAKAARVSEKASHDNDAMPTSQATSASSAASSSDEFVDLLRLEEENKNLRRQLGDKLRAENADLRKRLKQD